MKKIILLLLITFSFSQQECMYQDITVPINQNTQSIDISNYVTLVSGYYQIEPLYIQSNISSVGSWYIECRNTTAGYTSNIAAYYSDDTQDGGGIHTNTDEEATIGSQSPVFNIWWENDLSNETIEFDLVLRVTGNFDTSQLDIDDDSNIVHGYSLEKPYPNPFNPTTTISFSIPSYEFVSIKVYDLNGRLVSTLLEENLNPGRHNLTWNGKDYSSGQYFVKMKSENYSKTEAVTLVK